MQYEVLFEATKRVAEQVSIEASSPEEAVKIALEQHSGPRSRTVTVTLQPTWVDESNQVEKTGEFSMEFIGSCIDCKLPVLNGNPQPDRPWTYDSIGNEHNPDLICYACAMKRQEQGLWPEKK